MLEAFHDALLRNPGYPSGSGTLSRWKKTWNTPKLPTAAKTDDREPAPHAEDEEEVSEEQQHGHAEADDLEQALPAASATTT